MWHLIQDGVFIKDIKMGYADGYWHGVQAGFTVIGVGELRHRDGRLAYFTPPPDREEALKQIKKLHGGNIWKGM